MVSVLCAWFLFCVRGSFFVCVFLFLFAWFLFFICVVSFLFACFLFCLRGFLSCLRVFFFVCSVSLVGHRRFEVKIKCDSPVTHSIMSLRHLSFLCKSPSFLGKLSSETTKTSRESIFDGFLERPCSFAFHGVFFKRQNGYQENSPRSVRQKLEKVCLVFICNSLFLSIYNGLIFNSVVKN